MQWGYGENLTKETYSLTDFGCADGTDHSCSGNTTYTFEAHEFPPDWNYTVYGEPRYLNGALNPYRVDPFADDCFGSEAARAEVLLLGQASFEIPAEIIAASQGFSLVNVTLAATGWNGLSTGAKGGIGAGVGLVVLLLLAVCLYCVLQRRKKRQMRSHQLASSHPGALRRDPSIPWRKTEMAANEEPLIGAPPGKYEMGSRSSRSWAGPTEVDSVSGANELDTRDTTRYGSRNHEGKQVLQVEKTTSPLPEAAGLPRSPKQPTDRIVSSAQLATDINVMKASERELAHTIEADESLRKLKAEHAALQQRIAVAEMQAAEAKRKAR